ncbi:MAG: hypothetical protein EHM25_02760 [Nitrosopumilales archaeon]|nr:MAG: hypothetical protein EHM25_12420 [Nitrosopumilales archaeon]RPJ31575.1 MAG: hypothetical protein EHM25_02760 [Nitrosopumilales archaeon]
MIVELFNESNGLSAIFMTHSEYVSKYGYPSLLSNYCVMEGELPIIPMNAHSGFTANNPSRTQTNAGLGANGSVLQAFSLAEKIVSMEFTNYYTELDARGVSVNQYLSILLGDAFSTSEIKVIVNNKYTNYFYSSENTNTEGRIIELISSRQGEEALWLSEFQSSTFYANELYNPYIPKLMPSNLLIGSKVYPFMLEFVALSTAKPRIKVGASMLGTWDYVEIRDLTNNQYVNINNTIYQDNFITIDSDELTVINESGVDRSDIVTGDIFLVFSGGINKLEWTLNNTTEYHDLQYIPQDMQLGVSFDVRVQSVI